MRRRFGGSVVGVSSIASVASALAVLALLATAAGCAGGDADGATTGDEQNATALSSAGGDPITLQNWENYPAIVDIRHEVEGIDASQLTLQKQQFCENQGVGEFERDMDRDTSGKIRKLVLQDGSEDGAATTSYYYDDAGKLRFVFETENDVHGNSSEMRVYFDATGKRIWDVFRSASDPEGNKPDVSKAPFVAPPIPLVVSPDLANPAAVFGGPPKCG